MLGIVHLRNNLELLLSNGLSQSLIVGFKDLAGFGQNVFWDPEQMGQGVINNVDDTEKDRELNQQGKTAAHGVIPVSFIELHHLFLLFLLIVGVFFVDLIDLWLEDRHFGRGLLLLHRKREESRFDQNGKEDQYDAIAGDHFIEEPHDPTERDAEELRHEQVPF